MNNLKQNEIDKIKEWLMLECELDDEIFNYYFVNLGNDTKEIYNNYVYEEFVLYLNTEYIASYDEFMKATELELDDRVYSEINRYIKLSDGNIYYINDNTLLG